MNLLIKLADVYGTLLDSKNQPNSRLQPKHLPCSGRSHHPNRIPDPTSTPHETHKGVQSQVPRKSRSALILLKLRTSSSDGRQISKQFWLPKGGSIESSAVAVLQMVLWSSREEPRALFRFTAGWLLCSCMAQRRSVLKSMRPVLFRPERGEESVFQGTDIALAHPSKVIIYACKLEREALWSLPMRLPTPRDFPFCFFSVVSEAFSYGSGSSSALSLVPVDRNEAELYSALPCARSTNFLTP